MNVILIFIAAYVFVAICFLEEFSRKWVQKWKEDLTIGIFVLIAALSLFWPAILVFKYGDKVLVSHRTEG